MRPRPGLLLASVLSLVSSAFAGGPLLVGGPTVGVDGVPMTWANGIVNYRVDGGNFTANVSNAQGVARVQAMFATWTSVPTASITANQIGPILATGAFTDGDVSTVAEFNAVSASCDAGSQSPIIFDANGSIFQTLVGDPGVIGFAGPCDIDSSNHIISGLAMMNGSFQDGVFNSSNYEINSAMFDEALTHEIGHFLGLDHSQINIEAFSLGDCSSDAHAGVPLMFPYLYCNARTIMGLPKLSVDDVAWISKLYPAASFGSSYGVIQGRVLFTDGISGAQGVNVIARSVSNPKRIAVSVVSGFRMTGNPGQAVTGDNTGGSSFGSRDPSLEGFFEIAVPPGDYTLEVESVSSQFTDGSSVGPLDPPFANPGFNEFWNDTESSADDPAAFTTITVGPGALLTGKNFILNGTASRFDDYEEE